jgi:hypothetical protein
VKKRYASTPALKNSLSLKLADVITPAAAKTPDKTPPKTTEIPADAFAAVL